MSCDASKIELLASERSERVSVLIHHNEPNKNRSSTFDSMMCLFYTEIFSRPILFKDWKPIQCKSRKYHQIHNLYPVLVHSYIFYTLLFAYTLICQRRRLYFPNKDKNNQYSQNYKWHRRWKMENLGFKTNQIFPLKLFLLGFLLESFCSAVLGCTFQWIYLKR